jgi:hypothetical protein
MQTSNFTDNSNPAAGKRRKAREAGLFLSSEQEAELKRDWAVAKDAMPKFELARDGSSLREPRSRLTSESSLSYGLRSFMRSIADIRAGIFDEHVGATILIALVFIFMPLGDRP